MTRKTYASLPQQIRELHNHPGLLHGNPPHIDSILWMRIEMLARHAERLLAIQQSKRLAALPGPRNLTPPQRVQPTSINPHWTLALAVFGD